MEGAAPAFCTRSLVFASAGSATTNDVREEDPLWLWHGLAGATYRWRARNHRFEATRNGDTGGDSGAAASRKGLMDLPRDT